MSLLDWAVQYRWVPVAGLWISFVFKVFRFLRKQNRGEGVLHTVIGWAAVLIAATWLLVGNGIQTMLDVIDWAVEEIPDFLGRVSIDVSGDLLDPCGAPGLVTVEDCPPADKTTG